jgi:quercetin dioxygenase-like cupin family protein
MYFFNIPSMAYQKKRDRVFIKSVTGEKSQLCFMRLEPGEVTDHHHPQEQIGYILAGQVEITIDGQKKNLGPGDAYYIPGNIQHGFSVLTDETVEYLEIFSPPKAENKT